MVDFSMLELPKNDVEKAGEYLDQQLSKGHDYFKIRLEDLMFEKMIG